VKFLQRADPVLQRALILIVLLALTAFSSGCGGDRPKNTPDATPPSVRLHAVVNGARIELPPWGIFWFQFAAADHPKLTLDSWDERSGIKQEAIRVSYTLHCVNIAQGRTKTVEGEQVASYEASEAERPVPEYSLTLTLPDIVDAMPASADAWQEGMWKGCMNPPGAAQQFTFDSLEAVARGSATDEAGNTAFMPQVKLSYAPRLRLLDYNFGGGLDGLAAEQNWPKNLNRLADILRYGKVDVAFIQEAYDLTEPNPTCWFLHSFSSQTLLLAEKSPLKNSHWAKDADTQNGCVRSITGGNAILSRTSLSDRESYDTPRVQGAGGVDVATVATANLQGGATRLISGHFHGDGEFYDADVSEARRLMDRFPGRAILGADTNGSPPQLEESPVRNLRTGLDSASGQRQPPAFTFAPCAPGQTEEDWHDLDRIYMRPAVGAQGTPLRVVTYERRCGQPSLSDHLITYVRLG
jgi:endonuclease/exonuclease/phosphatase family metal-dependent hydrolase